MDVDVDEIRPGISRIMGIDHHDEQQTAEVPILALRMHEAGRVESGWILCPPQALEATSTGKQEILIANWLRLIWAV